MAHMAHRAGQGRANGRPSLLIAQANVDTSSAVVATRVGGMAREQEPDARHL